MKGVVLSLHRRAHAAAPALTRVAWLHLVIVPVLAALWMLDDRTVGGQPVWIKPLKFAVSTAVYGASLAWALSYVRERRRAVRWISNGTAAVMLLEVALIALQAGRGVKSHFNVGTPFDTAVFSTMGLAILVAWGLGVWATALVFRTRFDSAALGTSLRLGLAVTMVGAALGGTMTAPNAAQRARIAAGEPPSVAGAHAVGAPDDAPGLPFVGWSTQGGDLRVPHFFGLHAVQLLPLATLLLVRRRRLSEGRERAVARVLAGTYLALVAVLTLQAVRGEPLLAPSAVTLASGLLVVLLGAAAAGWLLARPASQPAAAT